MVHRVSHLTGCRYAQAVSIDYFGNRVHCFALEEAHTHLDVTAVSEVGTAPFQAPVADLGGPTRYVPATCTTTRA